MVLHKIIATLLFVSASLIGVACANSNAEVYSSVVSVDVTDVSSAAAREKAMNEANRKAFVSVVGKVATSSAVAKVSSLSDAQIINFVKEVSIVSEKASDVRYIADLQITLNGSLLRTYLKEQGIQFVETSTSTVLIVPVFREFKSDIPLLWESQNLWKKAWDENKNTGLVKIISIPTSGDNYAAIDAAKALSLNPSAMEQIARNNNTKDIFVADAVYDGIDGLNISLSSYQNGNVVFETIKVPGVRDEALFKDAIAKVSSRIEDKIKSQNIIENSQKSEITVLYEMNSMREWIATEKQLKGIGYIKSISIDAMGTGKVQFKISFVGTQEKLLHALRSKFYNLKKQGDFYILERV